jgi:hypothetical protein
MEANVIDGLIFGRITSSLYSRIIGRRDELFGRALGKKSSHQNRELNRFDKQWAIPRVPLSSIPAGIGLLIEKRRFSPPRLYSLRLVGTVTDGLRI